MDFIKLKTAIWGLQKDEIKYFSSILKIRIAK